MVVLPVVCYCKVTPTCYIGVTVLHWCLGVALLEQCNQLTPCYGDSGQIYCSHVILLESRTASLDAC